MNDNRAALIERHLELARRAARLYYPRVSHHVEFDELLAMANVGLTEAASRFDPDKGVAFKTFAWYRVQGAIVDGLRRMSTLPRSVWRQLLVLRATAEYLESQASRTATERAQAPAPTTADQLRSVKDAIGAIRTMYLVGLSREAEEVLASDVIGPDEHLGRQRTAAKLRAAIEKLPERERALLEKHYHEGKTLLDAGAELGLSKSWASRIHARAVGRLRELLGEPGS